MIAAAAPAAPRVPRTSLCAFASFPPATHVASWALVALASAACLPAFAGGPERVDGQERRARDSAPLRIGRVIRGDITGALTFSGEIRPTGQVPVIPRVAAQLDKLYVDLGTRVQAGEPLADLARAELEAQVLQAQAAQAAAEARLAQLRAGPRPEAVAQAQANLKAAQARLRALEAARTGANDPSALQKRLEEARAKLAQVESSGPPSPQAIAQADAAVEQARHRLNQLLGGPAGSSDPAALEAAREDVRQADQAAADARSGAPSQAAVERARREVQDAELALALARLSLNAFDLDQARALLEAAQAQAKLVEAPASPEELKAAEAAVEQAFALAELARMRLRDTSVTAPIAGVVIELHATPGSTVGPTAPLLTLIPPELQVTVHADEGQAAQVHVGQSAALSVESLPQDAFSGVVKAVAPVVDPRTRTVALRVEVADPRGKLRPGMFAQVAIQTTQRQRTVLVPRDAVVRAPQSESALSAAGAQNVVFLVADNRVRRQRVQLGISDARNVEVLEGLQEGTDVVLTPPPDLSDGELIAGS